MRTTRRETVLMLGAAVAMGTRLKAEPIPVQRFEGRQISAGENGPGLPMGGTNDALLAYLHLQVPADELARKLRLTVADFAARTDALAREGLARRLPDGQLRPAVLVVMRAEASRYLRANPSAVFAAADAIDSALPDIRRSYSALPGFTRIPFSKASLLVLSDVLLDNWQIDRVEKTFLKAPRPQRGGGRYYYAVFEVQQNDAVEPLGIYGNHCQAAGAATLCLYGNQRYNGPTNLVNLARDDLTTRFGFPSGTRVDEAQAALVGDLVRRWRDPSAPIAASRAAGLRSLGLLDAEGRTTIPVLGAQDQRGLDEMAAGFTPTLVAILEKHRPALIKQYQFSPYVAEGVGFPEFFIWWYHVFYTDVTNELARRGIIAIPPAGTLTYLTLS